MLSHDLPRARADAQGRRWLTPALTAFVMAGVALVVGPRAAAQDTEQGPQSGAPAPGWIAGIGYIRGANPFVAEPDGVSTAIPLVGYLGERLTWLGPYLNYRLRDADNAGDGFDVNLTAALRFQGFSYDGDDPRLVGLRDRDVALDAGGSIGRAGFKLELLADVSGTHDGYELALSYAHDLQLNRRTRLTLSGNLAWQSANLVDYYYGVSAQEAAPTRAAYEASAGTNIGVGADLNFFITRQWMFLARTRVTALADDIVDSPIVEDDYESSAMLGIVYRFGGS